MSGARGPSEYKSQAHTSNFQQKSQISMVADGRVDLPQSGDPQIQRETFFKTYRERLNKHYQQLHSGNVFPVYQQGLLSKPDNKYQQDGVSELTINPEQISPMIKALQQENQILKEECNTLSGDLAKFIGIIELVLQENQQIRDHINQKNRDIEQVIQTIGLNDSEEIHDLNHKIHLLTQENNILLQHLEETKKFKESYEEQVLHSEDEIHKAREIFEEEKQKNQDFLLRLEFSQKQLFEAQSEREQIRQKEHGLKLEVQKLQKDLNSKEKEFSSLKTLYENEKKKNEEIENDLKEKNDNLNETLIVINRDLKEQNQKIQEIKRNFDIEIGERKQREKYVNELEIKYHEAKEVISDISTQMHLERARVEASIHREKDMKEQRDKALNEKQKAVIQLDLFDKQFKNLLESSQYDMEEKHQQYDGLIQKQKEEHKERINKKDEEIQRLKHQSDEQTKELERLRKENDTQNREIGEIQSKLQYSNENRQIIESQSIELRKQENEIIEFKSLLNQYKMQLQSGPKNDEHAQILQQRITELQEQIAHLQKYKEEYDTVVEEQEILSEKYNQTMEDFEEVQSDNEKLRTANSLLQDNLDIQIAQVTQLRLNTVPVHYQAPPPPPIAPQPAYDTYYGDQNNYYNTQDQMPRQPQINFSAASTYDQGTGDMFQRDTMQTSASKTQLGNIPIVDSRVNQNPQQGSNNTQFSAYGNTPASNTGNNNNFSNNVYLKQ